MRMKILWITNCEPSIIAQKHNNVFFSGSWINYSHELLGHCESIDLYVLSCGRTYDWENVEGIHYAGFTLDDFNKIIVSTLDDICPDIIHIWGTEYEHFLKVVNISEERKIIDKVVVSIQGLVSIIDNYYCFALPEKVKKRKTIYEFLRKTSIEAAQKALKRRGELEIEGLKKVQNCIGRTDWDKAITRQYNQDIRYFKCNEILRKKFYDARWDYDKCEKHSITFSQSGYILKGFHVLLKALEIVKQFYPDVKVYAIGKNPYLYDGIVDRIKRYSYREYIGELINEKNLIDNVKFVGFLNEEQMIKHYQRGNVFVCASGIENSSNSIGEAMMLGMPIVASDVGGVKTFIDHNHEGILYQSDSANMLADGIMRVFADEEFAKNMGQSAHIKANEIYDYKKNTEEMKAIYSRIYKNI